MQKQPINYLYFGFFFCLLTLLAASGIFNKSDLSGSGFFFFLYALGQITLEVVIFIFLGSLIAKYLGKFCFNMFIGATFVALFVHIFDFFMDRVLDLSVWAAIRIFVLDESLENFLYLLDASGISLWVWLGFFGFLVTLPFIGILLYHLSMKIVEKRPLHLWSGQFLQAVICMPLALFLWDFSASKVIHPDAYTAFTTSLPWKTTFLEPQKAHFNLSGSLNKPLHENQVAQFIASDDTVLEHRPNIYLFVVESLRADVINDKIAPHLNQFKNESTHFKRAISGGNGTHLSWFSIFHSQLPFLWKYLQKKDWQMGSPAINLLKKWGYQTQLYTSAQLGYYGMNDLLFGKNGHLIDQRNEFLHAPPLTAAESDREALQTLLKNVQENPELQQGQLFIIFLDCTHFEYNWPKNWQPKFTPFAQEFAYFRTFHSKKTIRAIKNRYNNAVNYMDSLFGSFYESLPDKENAIIAFTGDHGEEFFEHGHLFHNSHLTHVQTNVPLYIKFGNQPPLEKALGSQMDIFPTIIHHLSGKSFAFLEGSHITEYAVTARFNAGRTPYEFSIDNGKNKLIAQFSNRHNIFKGEKLKIISLRSSNDERMDVDDVKEWVNKEFGKALKRLFKN